MPVGKENFMIEIEFGEKLKKRREEKGMTQQTLADKLYVTRQAVSRWECGARYPDLITAKRIAEELEISLDELVSGEKYIRDIEKEPVITATKALIMQTVLYAVACVPYLALCFYDMGVKIPYEIRFYEQMDISMTMFIAVVIIGNLVNFMVMIIGFYYSVRNELSSHYVGWIMSSRFFVDIVTMAIIIPIMVLPIIRSGNGMLAWSSKLRIPFVLIAPFVLLIFFNAKKPVNVKYVYIVVFILAAFLLNDIRWFVHRMQYDINLVENISAYGIDADLVISIIDIIGDLAYMLLLAFQAYTLDKKRAAV